MKMVPTWTRIGKEIEKDNNDFDKVRRRLLKALSDYTGRNTIIYATDFLEPERGKPLAGVSLDLNDKSGFFEVTENLVGPSLDIIIESPGGSPEAALAIVNMLRSKFTDIRFIIPNVAKSAATMLALSGNAILMDEKSELGPTDPQMVFKRDGATMMAPAQAILDQFQKATKSISSDPTLLPAWIPILNQYGPSLLQECENAISLTKQWTANWLQQYMFSEDPDKIVKSEAIAKEFADNTIHLSHKKMIGINDAKKMGLKIIDMREDKLLQTKVWELYQSINITFSGTGAIKIFENQLNDAYIQVAQQIQIPLGALQNQGQAPFQTPSPPALMTRQQKRQADRQNR
jgi:hypothetical protein